jgi:hypothetical protein
LRRFSNGIKAWTTRHGHVERPPEWLKIKTRLCWGTDAASEDKPNGGPYHQPMEEMLTISQWAEERSAAFTLFYDLKSTMIAYQRRVVWGP